MLYNTRQTNVLPSLLILICVTLKPHQSLSNMQGSLTILIHMPLLEVTTWTLPEPAVCAAALNFHSGARIVTHQNKTSRQAKPWAPCSIRKQHMQQQQIILTMEKLQLGTSNCQLCDHLQDLKALKLAERMPRDTVLYSKQHCFFWRWWDQKGLSIFTLAFREVSCILPRVPYPLQANEHLSPPLSACIISKLDFTAVETFTAALLPPQGSKWVHSEICCYKMLQIEPTQN